MKRESMVKALACHMVLFGLLGASGPAAALSTRDALRRARADWEQGRPLWSLCEPRRSKTPGGVGQRHQTLPTPVDTRPSLSDCAGIDGPEPALFGSGSTSGVPSGMSSQFDEDDEAPVCGGGSRCSPVPTERSHAVSGLTMVKAIVPPVRILPRDPDHRRAPPRSIGAADDGHPMPPFEPPRPAAAPIPA